jgi:ribosomal protein S18 acetylase RimI-like enzyme
MMSGIKFCVLESFNTGLILKLKELEIKNLGTDSAINEWQIPVFIRYGKFIIAEEKKRIIGVCQAIRAWNKPEKAFIHSFYIEKEFRNRGIGSSFLEFVLDLFRKDGISETGLTVDPANDAALKLYKSAGFEIIKMLKDEYGRKTDRYLMEVKFE